MAVDQTLQTRVLKGQTDVDGALDVNSGGEIDIESGASLKLAGTAITATAAELNKLDTFTGTAAQLNTATANIPTLGVETAANPVSTTNGTTADVTIAQTGLTLLTCTGSTATATCCFKLPAPAVGVRKQVTAYKGIDATHIAAVETHAKGTHVGYTAANHRLTFNALDETVELLGASATQWILISNTGAVSLSTKRTS